MFPVCILWRKQRIVKLEAIRWRIANQMREWKKRLIPELVQCVVAMARRGTGDKRATDDKSIARTFH